MATKWYTGHEENRCTASCWQGDPKHSLAAKARCTRPVHDDQHHVDENGNHFTGSGEDARVRTLR